MDRAGAVVLNSSLWSPRRFRCNHSEIIKPSRVTVIVPASGPNSKTEVKTKVSETDRVAGIDGNLIVMDPLSNVSNASRNHWGGTGSEHRV